MSKYDNVIELFASSVWLITDSKLNAIRSAVENAVNGNTDIATLEQFRQEAPQGHSIGDGGYALSNGVARINIHGTIIPRANLMSAYSGGTSMEKTRALLQHARTNPEVKSIFLHVDSSGGSVHGVAETAKLIREIRAEKRVVSLVEGIGASAGFFLSSAAGERYATEDSLVGNMGVVMKVMDVSEKLKNDGVKFEIFRSTELKGQGCGIEPLTDDMRTELQSLVDGYAEQFVSNVAANLNISIDDARKMADARTHLGPEAKELGFVDDIKTSAEILAEMSAENSAQDKMGELSAAYDALKASFEEYQLEAQAQLEQYGEVVEGLTAQINTSQEQAFSAKVEAAVKELTEGLDAKFAPAMADQLREQLTANFEGTMAMAALMPKGAAAPQGLELEAKATEPKIDAEEGAPFDAEGNAIAYSQEEADILEKFGTRYVKNF